jgi:hypothetical protein
MQDADWRTLLSRIRRGEVTPFLGAGAAHPALPLGRELSKELAAAFNYPMDDSDDLTRVTQFMAVKEDPMMPKDYLADRLQDRPPPNFDQDGEPHGLLAELPLPLYLTTNYDDFMVQALRHKRREPVQTESGWYDLLGDRQDPVFESETGFRWDPQKPVVFHLHGHFRNRLSMVLTEDDYFEYLIRMSKDMRRVIPDQIKGALAQSVVLFIGYSLRDWDLRVILRGLLSQISSTSRRGSVTVQLKPGPEEQTALRQQQYLDAYYTNLKMRIYWGTASDFARELQQRWRELPRGD